MGGGVLMVINSIINYLCRDDIKLDLEFIDVLAIEIPNDELNFTDKFTKLLQFLNRENIYNYYFYIRGC